MIMNDRGFSLRDLPPRPFQAGKVGKEREKIFPSPLPGEFYRPGFRRAVLPAGLHDSFPGLPAKERPADRIMLFESGFCLRIHGRPVFPPHPGPLPRLGGEGRVRGFSLFLGAEDVSGYAVFSLQCSLHYFLVPLHPLWPGFSAGFSPSGFCSPPFF